MAKFRDEFGLSERSLGEIDASAETIKLGTFGLRGIAVNILWNQANHYKMVEDWAMFGAALTQITALEPHFYTVWDFQAHNLSYNTSVEFDDYHVRYHWVREGIEFLKRGKALNKNEPRLTGHIGWFISQKIGKSDEHRQFRRLFKEDDEFHASDNPSRGRDRRDSWLVGNEYYNRAWDEVIKGSPLRTTPVIFYSQPLMTLIYFADALESDSTAGEVPRFGEVARLAWQNAAKEMVRFGNKEIPSPFGAFIRLNALEEHVAQQQRIENQLNGLLPGQFAQLKKTQRDKLPAEAIRALETPASKRDGPQHSEAIDFWKQVAEQAPEAQRAAARKLVGQYERLELADRDIRSLRGVVNYDYWKTRCEAEPTDEALAARKLTYEAEIERREARPMVAKKRYEDAFQQWRKVLDKFQVLREDTLMADDLNETIENYRSVLRQLNGDDAKFPDKFILQDVLNQAKAKPATETRKSRPQRRSQARRRNRASTIVRRKFRRRARIPRTRVRARRKNCMRRKPRRRRALPRRRRPTGHPPTSRRPKNRRAGNNRDNHNRLARLMRTLGKRPTRRKFITGENLRYIVA